MSLADPVVGEPQAAPPLPRVTYTNVHADFAPLHVLIDQRLPDAQRRLLGLQRANLIDGHNDDRGRIYQAVSPIDDPAFFAAVARALQ